MAPFTFMNNDTEKIRTEVQRDCEMIKATGSINNGNSLKSLKIVMETILEYGCYYFTSSISLLMYIIIFFSILSAKSKGLEQSKKK